MDRATLGRLLLALVGIVIVSVGFMVWFLPLGLIFFGASLVWIAFSWQSLVVARLSDEVS